MALLGRWRRGGARGVRSVVAWLLLSVLVIAYVKPLRNALLYPVWPSQWRTLGSYQLLDRHVRDLFYPMDRTPFTGPCEAVRNRLKQLQILELADQLNSTFRVHSQSDWDQWEDKIAVSVDPETLKSLRYFRPALTETEQRALLRALLIATSSLEAFNVSYVAAEGTLIGALRHRDLVPWDDDADLTFQADQWETAKAVLSCVPGFQLKIHSDFMWKFFSVDSPLWKDEAVTRFPYIDLFPYVEDEEYIWPLVIWLKDKMLWPRHQVFPTRLQAFDNFVIRVPRDVRGTLTHLFGDVLDECESRLFERRERRLMPMDERIRLPCSQLHEVYPFFAGTPQDASPRTG